MQVWTSSCFPLSEQVLPPGRGQEGRNGIMTEEEEDDEGEVMDKGLGPWR